MNLKILLPVICLLCACSPKPQNQEIKAIRIASYNVALFRSEQGALAKDLKSGTDQQIQNIAAVIQKVRPDIIALLEFDYDPTGQLVKDFQKKYLDVGQQDQSPISYKYAMQFSSNTGIPSNADYNNDGKVALPNDAFGYGKYEGQYAFALLSRYPLDAEDPSQLSKFLMEEHAGGEIPKRGNGTPYYSNAAWKKFRLSSKNHIDIPIKITKDKMIHAIIAHPTPPVFDGPEDRNGLRNNDEIRLLKDYISNEDYLIDDSGYKGGLAVGSSFIVMGDLNADPIDGDSYPGAINQLLNSPLVNQGAATGKLVPASNGGKSHNRRKGDRGDPANDTAFFGARIDYVLPSKDLKVERTGVFWPDEGELLYEIVKDKGASDHLLVWVDIVF